MRKTDKKHERMLVEALTRVCDQALEEIDGFSWITHFVDFNNFPDSLLVVCVFKTEEQLRAVRSAKEDAYLSKRVVEELQSEAVPISATWRRVQFDTEEACASSHSGDWQARYRSRPAVPRI
ncbi:hypothetical protein R0137_02010 [Congregibacter brevis]|uniref:Fis family transcriptional regulator n=1 Tax=Congregibacter brevis TaxID=3081201 RepID=A0ABZ0ICU4_9GAMM|nr:hypothetical protein R0137_02010 [Congregibacter sp. IMCC45268]